MEEKKVIVKRKKPKFLRTDWHKKIKLGSSVKKVRKWRAAKGRHNKLRLNRKGHSRRPKIGWGASRQNALLKNGFASRTLSLKNASLKNVRGNRILNLKDLDGLKNREFILIGKVGIRKRKEIVAKVNEMGIKVLNKYKTDNRKQIIENGGKGK